MRYEQRSAELLFSVLEKSSRTFQHLMAANPKAWWLQREALKAQMQDDVTAVQSAKEQNEVSLIS